MVKYIMPRNQAFVICPFCGAILIIDFTNRNEKASELSVVPNYQHPTSIQPACQHAPVYTHIATLLGLRGHRGPIAAG